MGRAARLADALGQLGLVLPRERQELLLAYLDLLAKWNRTYNLTAVRDPEAMLVRHLFDSLAAIPAIEKSVLAGRRDAGPWRLTDVGSGAGLPGLVLAAARPEWRIRSVEAVDKKAAFQRQACIELGLSNVEVVGARIESVAAGSADAVISRAFADLAEFVRIAGHVADRLLAMKGILPAGEIARLPAGWRLAQALPLAVPQLDEQRHLIVLEKA